MTSALDPPSVRLADHIVPIFLIAAVHSLIALYWQPSSDTFPIDDPYIHLVYGANLAHGEGFAYNAGEPSMGTSSPLWTVIVALFTPLFSNMVAAMSLLGSSLLLVAAVLLYLLVFSAIGHDGVPLVQARLSALACSVILLGSGNAQWISLSGMETPLYIVAVLLTLFVHARRGLSMPVGLCLAVAVTTRLCGLFLAIATAMQAAVNARSANVRSFAPLAVPAAALGGLALHSWVIVGNALPTTMGGKKATYVPGDFDLVAAIEFVGSYFAFLTHQPMYLPLMAILIGYGLLETYAVLAATLQRKRYELSSRGMIALWAVLHLAAFALTFRSLLHYGRYLLPLVPAAIAVFAMLAHACARRLRGDRYRWLPTAALALIAGINLATLPLWKTLYHNDIRHIRQTYVKTSEWVRDNTPADAIIAAYDIGAVKYISGRRIVDLFGLLDERLHPLLRARDAASYLRASAAQYVLYLQHPNTEVHTRIYLAEYGSDFFLDQRFQTSFSSSPYPQPTITQSFTIDIFTVEGWHPATLEGRRSQFVLSTAPTEMRAPVHADFGGKVALLGVDIEAERTEQTFVMRRILDIPTLGFRMTFYWQKLAGDSLLPEAEIHFVDPETAETKYEMRHRIAHGRADGLARQGEVVREPHFVWLPNEIRSKTLSIRVRLYDRRTRVPLPASNGSSEVAVATLTIEPPFPLGL